MGFGTTLETEMLVVDEHVLDDVSEVAVLPGTHRVRAKLIWNTGGFNHHFEDPSDLVFVAAAGHAYQVKANAREVESNRAIATFWIEDQETDAVVAGTRPVD